MLQSLVRGKIWLSAYGFGTFGVRKGANHYCIYYSKSHTQSNMLVQIGYKAVFPSLFIAGKGKIVYHALITKMSLILFCD